MIVYKITNLINNKIYIGQTVQKMILRFQAHFVESKRGSERPICRAIRKYGKENFIIEQVGSAKNIEDLNKLEIELIKKYESLTTQHGYNATEGGKNFRFTEETKLKQSLAKKGKPSNKKDFSCSPETAAKIGAANKGNTAWNKGRKMTEAECIKHGQVRKGMKAWNKGKRLNLKQIIAINLETLEETIFSSIHEVVEVLNVGRCAVQNVLSGRGKRTANNYTYKYL